MCHSKTKKKTDKLLQSYHERTKRTRGQIKQNLLQIIGGDCWRNIKKTKLPSKLKIGYRLINTWLSSGQFKCLIYTEMQFYFPIYLEKIRLSFFYGRHFVFQEFNENLIKWRLVYLKQTFLAYLPPFLKGNGF